MAQTLKKVDGDLEIGGSIIVRGGINNPQLSRNVTRLASTEESVGAIKGGTDPYILNSPPTNNVTDVQFEVEYNSDGSFNIIATFNYIQGDIPADGFLIFYKSDIDAPDVINMNNDPSVFVAWTDTN